MRESVEKRVRLVASSEEPEDLRENLCPFFKKGGYDGCLACKQSEADLCECKEYYLERITLTPIEVWDSSFDKTVIKERDKTPLEGLTHIGVSCNTCYMYDKCPMYQKGYTCGIDWGSNKPKNPMDFMDFLINLQYERVRRSSVFEKVDGGVPDAGLSSEIDRLQSLVATKTDMNRDRLSISVEASGPASSGGGILSRIFGGGSSIPEKKPTAIPESPSSMDGIMDIEDAVEVKEEKVPRRREKR